MLSGAWAVGMLVGPMIGGALIASIGAAQTVIVQSVAFAAAALLTVALRTPLDAAPAGPPDAAWAALKQGLALVVRDRIIRAYMWIMATVNTVSVGAHALIVPLLREELHLSSGQAGAILAVGAGVGGLGTAALVPFFIRRLGGQPLVGI